MSYFSVKARGFFSIDTQQTELILSYWQLGKCGSSENHFDLSTSRGTEMHTFTYAGLTNLATVPSPYGFKEPSKSEVNVK